MSAVSSARTISIEYADHPAPTMARHRSTTMFADFFCSEGLDDEEYSRRGDLFVAEDKEPYFDYWTNAKLDWVERYQTASLLAYPTHTVTNSDINLVDVRQGVRDTLQIKIEGNLASSRIQSSSQLKELRDLTNKIVCFISSI
jgi:hypothetical protein